MPILLHLAAVQLAGLRIVTPPFTDNATPLLSVGRMMLRVSTELQGSALHDIVNAQSGCGGSPLLTVSSPSFDVAAAL